jgi:outer membrane lipoprotein SlyB
MKSVSGDPMYAVGCGAAMAATAAGAIAGGAVLIKEAVNRNTRSETVTQEPDTGSQISKP